MDWLPAQQAVQTTDGCPGALHASAVLIIAWNGVLLGLGKRVRGIEPPYRAWEARVLPLNYTRERL
jgi:hypothetical protein